MLIAIDHGNKQMKLPSGKVFTSGIRESNTRPPFGEDFLVYKGKYYTISDKRIPYMRDKTVDDRFYVLTLFAIAFEIEAAANVATKATSTMTAIARYCESGLVPIQLLVGLPPAHFGAQYERFEKYFKRNVAEEIEFRGRKIKFYISEATAFPQAFAAAMPVYHHINTFPKVMVLDIGGFTADYLMIKNGQADLSVCDSLEHGVIVLYNQIIGRVNSDLDILLDESDIDTILKGEANHFTADTQRIVNDTAQIFISDLLGMLRERGIDLRSGKTVFVGGGSILLRRQIEASGKVVSPIFVEKISANARGYELLHTAAKARR